MHVDAAWAGTAAILPEQRHWFDGLDKVDSYSFNPYSKHAALGWLYLMTHSSATAVSIELMEHTLHLAGAWVLLPFLSTHCCAVDHHLPSPARSSLGADGLHRFAHD